MAYSFPEFPHTNYNDDDLREIIELYKSLKSEYVELNENIRTLSNRLDQYERDVQSRLDEKVNIAIQPLRTQITNDLATNRIELQTIRNDLTSMVQNIDIRSMQKINDGLQSINDRVTVIEQEVQHDFQEYESYIDSQLKNGLDTINTSTQEALTNITSILSQLIDTQFRMIEDKISDLEAKINPVTLWDNVYQMFGFNALEWYNYTDVTCEDWNKKGVTCSEWYINGKNIFNYDKEQEKIINPLTGELQEVKEIVLQYILNSMPQRMSAQQFDNLRLTAEAFDKLMLTAEEYDLKGEYNDFRHNRKFKPTAI